MKLPDLKELKAQAVLWVVPAYIAAYVIDTHANGFYFSWIIDLATSEGYLLRFAGYSFGLLLISTITSALFWGYYHALKFLDANLTMGLLSPVVAFALLAAGLLGLEPVFTKSAVSNFSPLWHLGFFAHGFFTLRFWADIKL